MKFLNFGWLFIILLMSSCGDRKNSQASGEDRFPDYPVLVVSPQKANLQNVYPATIEGQQDIEIRPKVDGYIEEIFVDEGAMVKKGDPLFKISAPQYEQEVLTAEAAIRISEANVSTAQL